MPHSPSRTQRPKRDVVWFALNDDQPPLASAGIWNDRPDDCCIKCKFGFHNMPKDDWAPRPDEVDRFYQVYIDESSQNKHQYMVLGGLCVPLGYSAQFEADIIDHRDHTTPVSKVDGTAKLMKWEKANAYNLVAYKRVVDAYFTFPTRHKLPLSKSVDTHCLAVNTSKKTPKATGEGDVEIGFAKEFYFLCVPTIGNRLKRGLFHLYPDTRTTNQTLNEARKIMNAGAQIQ
jgi:hypothetical protein